MSISSTLASIQEEIKKEKVTESFNYNRITGINEKLFEATHQYLSSKKFHFFFHWYFPNREPLKANTKLCSSLLSNKNIFNPIEDRKYLEMKSGFNGDDEKKISVNILRFIQYFRSSTQEFQTELLNLWERQRGCIDLLTFSVIPTVFGLLSQTKDQKDFIDFVFDISCKNKELGFKLCRALFVMPEFRNYTNKIYESLKDHFSVITGTKMAETVLNQFLENAEEYISQCPAIFKYFVQKDKNCEFLKNSFFLPFIHSTCLYGFSQIDEDRYALEVSSFILIERANNIGFIQHLAEILSKSCQVNYYDQTANILPVYSSIYYLTLYDAQMISSIASCMKCFKNKTGKIISPPKSPTEYQLFIVKDSIGFKGGARIINKNALDQVHDALTDLIIDADDIPSNAISNLKPNQILDNIVKYSPSFNAAKSRIQNEIFNNKYETYIKGTSKDNVSIEEIINSLKNSFNYKENDKCQTDELQKFSGAYKMIKQYLNQISILLYEHHFLLHFYVSSISLDPFITKGFEQFLSLASFTKFFSDLDNQWKVISLNQGYDFKLFPESILFCFLSKFQYSYFAKNMPKLIEFDDKFKKLTYDEVSDTDNSKLDKLLKSETSQFQSAIERIKQAYEFNSPLLFLKYISISRTIIQNILFEIFPEAGENELFPTVIFLVYQAKPRSFISKTEYLFRAFQGISGTMTQSYGEKLLNNIVLLRQASLYFTKLFGGNEAIQYLDSFLK